MRRLVLIIFFIISNCCIAQVGKVSVTVLDEQTNVLANTEVSASFSTLEKAWHAGPSNRFKKNTNNKGFCSIIGHGNGGSCIIYVTRKGYYHSYEEIHFKNKVGIGRLATWQPWNSEFKLYLTKIDNPTPMYVKSLMNEDLPCKNKRIGYDFRIGDWVYVGYAGKHTDIYFYVGNLTTNNNSKYESGEGLIVSFPNDGDGLIPLDIPDYRNRGMRMPKVALVTGFEPVLVKFARPGAGGGFEEKKSMHYFLRVNTEKDKNGDIIKANYGKIYNDFTGDRRGRMNFIYYLNPTSDDRNIEYDNSTNLVENVLRKNIYSP